MSLRNRCFATAAVAFMAVFAIYGSTKEIGEAGEETVSLPWGEQKETMYFWYSDESLSDVINSAAVVFGEQEGVHVIPVYKEKEGYLEEVNRATVNEPKKLPDAYIINNDALEQAYLAGLAEPIQNTDVISEENLFAETAMASVSYGKSPVAYPFYFDTVSLIYNEDYLKQWLAQQAEKEAQNEQALPDGEAGQDAEAGDEALDETEQEELTEEELAEEENNRILRSQIDEKGIPSTMEALLYIANTFDVPEEVDGIMRWDVSDIFYNYWFVGQYLQVGGEQGDNPALVDINNAETIECLSFYQYLNQFFSIESDVVTVDHCLEDFKAGKLVFTLGNISTLQALEAAKEAGETTVNFGVATLPDIRTDLQSRALSVTNGVAINGYSEHKDLANAFAKYLTCECGEDLYARSGKVSACEKTQRDPKIQVFYEEYKGSVSLPKLMEINNLWLQLEVLLAKVWNGEDPAPLAEQLSEDISGQILDR